jgi:2-iminobutanoate/2-iminopropanoate deaminase
MKRISTSLTIALFAFAFSISAEAQQPRSNQQPSGTGAASVEHSSAAAPSNRPFSDFVRVGNVLYLSGKLGTDSSGKLAAGGIAAETKQTLENIRTILEKNGSSLDYVIKCTVMLADMKEWSAMNAVYTTFFKKDRMPARSAFGTSGLALDARVEIECMAAIK